MKLYRIKDWNEIYENSRSRVVKDLDWVPTPNNHDGEQYTILIQRKDGAELFTAWILILQVASKCNPRGVLVKGSGEPHTAQSLALKTRAPEKWFEHALPYLANVAKWLECSELADACHDDDGTMTASRHLSAEEGKGREEKEGKEKAQAPGPYKGVEIPLELNTPEFLELWGKWKQHLKQKRKPYTIVAEETKLHELKQWGLSRAIVAIKHSMGNGWQGIFEPHASNQQTSRDRNNNCNAGTSSQYANVGKIT